MMLEVKDLSKTYKDVQALNHVHLTLKEGVYALLGLMVLENQH